MMTDEEENDETQILSVSLESKSDDFDHFLQITNISRQIQAKAFEGNCEMEIG